MDSIKFSIIVPIYNSEKYLEYCLNSIINQTYTNIEIILVNDGSSDNSPEICDNYANKDCRISVIHKANEGDCEARNVGIRNASGDYIVFVDSDDKINEKSCEIIADYIKTNSSTEVIHLHRHYIINGKLKEADDYYTKYVNKYISGHEYLLYFLKRGYYSYAPWRRVYKRSFLNDNNLFFDKRLKSGSSDYFLFFYVFLKASQVYVSDFVHYYYSLRPTSLSLSKNKTHLLNRANSIIPVLFELADRTHQFDDSELKSLLLDNFVMDYLTLLNNINTDYKPIDRNFIKMYAYKPKTKICAYSFLLHPCLFKLIFFLNKLIKNI